MFDAFENRLELHGVLTAETALRIGAGRSTRVTGSDLPVIRDAADRPFIPGASFKGALRARLEALLRGVGGDALACYPTDNERWCLTANEMDKLRKQARQKKWTDERFSREVVDKHCWACLLFGSPWLASTVQIRDLPVSSLWVGQYQVRDGVAIDRDTETAREGLLYDYEVVPAGTQFDCLIVVDNAKDWQLGLLFVGLDEFMEGRAALGGGRSRGLGAVRLTWEERTWVAGRGGLLDYLAGKGGKPVADGQVADWRRAFTKKLRGR